MMKADHRKRQFHGRIEQLVMPAILLTILIWTMATRTPKSFAAPMPTSPAPTVAKKGDKVFQVMPKTEKF